LFDFLVLLVCLYLEGGLDSFEFAFEPFDLFLEIGVVDVELGAFCFELCDFGADFAEGGFEIILYFFAFGGFLLYAFLDGFLYVDDGLLDFFDAAFEPLFFFEQQDGIAIAFFPLSFKFVLQEYEGIADGVEC
jgi:hypothetical protein